MDNLRFSSAPTADSIDASIAQHYPDCEPVAVIGYACHFPESPDGETFWQNLLEGRECSRRFTREELLAVGLDAAIIDDPHYVTWDLRAPAPTPSHLRATVAIKGSFRGAEF